MDEQENLAMENIAENTEVTAEEVTGQEKVEPVQQQPITESEKVYTEAEARAKLEAELDKRAHRMEARIRKEYEDKYGELEQVLFAGTGKNNVSEIATDFKKYYEQQGVKLPGKPMYTQHETEILANAEAEDIIEAGFDDVMAETNRLTKIGYDNMSPREKAVFRRLAEYRKETEKKRELSALGVAKEVYESKAFRDFAAKFDSATPVKEIYEIFDKMQPKKVIKPMGSMKSEVSDKGAVKDFYTREEALRFTRKDFDNNPELFKAVENSMLRWK